MQLHTRNIDCASSQELKGKRLQARLTNPTHPEVTGWDVFIEAFLISLLQAFAEIAGSRRETWWHWVEALTLTSALFRPICLFLSKSFFPACWNTIPYDNHIYSRRVAVEIRMVCRSCSPVFADLWRDYRMLSVLSFLNRLKVVITALWTNESHLCVKRGTTYKNSFNDILKLWKEKVNDDIWLWHLIHSTI